MNSAPHLISPPPGICKQWAQTGKCYFLTKLGKCRFLHFHHHGDDLCADMPWNNLRATPLAVDEALNLPFNIFFDLSYGYVDYRELRSLLVQLSAGYGMVRTAQKQVVDQIIADAPRIHTPSAFTLSRMRCIPQLIFAACDTVSSRTAPPLPCNALPAVHPKFDTRIPGGGSEGVFKWMEGKTIRQLLVEHQHANNWVGVLWESRSLLEVLQRFERSHKPLAQSSLSPDWKAEESEVGSSTVPSIRRAIVYLTPDSKTCVSEVPLHEYSHLNFIIGGVCDGTVLREASYRQVSSTSSAILLSASLPVKHAKLKKRCLNVETVVKTLMLFVSSLRAPQRSSSSLDLWVAALQGACPPRILR